MTNEASRWVRYLLVVWVAIGNLNLASVFPKSARVWREKYTKTTCSSYDLWVATLHRQFTETLENRRVDIAGEFCWKECKILLQENYVELNYDATSRVSPECWTGSCFSRSNSHQSLHTHCLGAQIMRSRNSEKHLISIYVQLFSNSPSHFEATWIVTLDPTDRIRAVLGGHRHFNMNINLIIRRQAYDLIVTNTNLKKDLST